MASYLESQLDFIYFFYGLAFILLGTLSLVIARGVPGPFSDVRLIGLFGCLHGATEWMDMAALTAGNSDAFAILRAAVLTLSYVLLTEFARRGAAKLGVWVPGPWIYLPLLSLLCGVGYVGGLDTAKALARYGFGATGAFGTGLVLFALRGSVSEAARPLIVAMAVTFGAYAIAAGFVVEASPFWPANRLNQTWFVEATGIPIQLVRGLIAVLLATLIWGAWGQRLMRTFDSPRYTAYLHRQFFSVLTTMAAVLVFGWLLTNFLGGIYRDEVEQEAAADADLLVSGIVGAVGATNAMVKVLAGSPAIALALTKRDDATRAAASSVLDFHVEAAGASRGLIVDPSGHVVDRSDRREPALLRAPDQQAAEWFEKSIRGGESRKLELDPVSGQRSYVTSQPVRDGAGSIVGVAALEVPLDRLGSRSRGFDRAFFLIDARDVVALTNRPSELFRTLWPRPELAPVALTQRLGAPDSPPMLRRQIIGGDWTSFAGRRAYVIRRDVGDTRWSLVLVQPVTGIAASRLLGIIITLQMAITALFYFFGRERGIRDRIQRLHRVELQERAFTLARQAATDPLTGLHNRLGFNERLEEELECARRTGRPLALIMYDVDHFKEVNDRFGHPTGDQVLIRLSMRAAASVRQTDLLARWGGEEFAILLIDTDLFAAAEVAEKLRQFFAGTAFGEVGPVTASFGVAEYRLGDSAETLLARADNALYRAKYNGRNRVELDAPVIENVALSPASERGDLQRRADRKSPTGT
ncbi:diguanylate cyclase [Rhodopseudomonas palustris]|uniref:GGDEF domain-containing protein n=1 Tax=Rhodopseudomonas palustris TaxID=1076 RepID=UPI002ACEADDF|nr:diguanylate cyclase [Rhodopseudomonas palustris]WQG99893.1 diguanylate cyclase [Rhodopseudomonas palustris]